MSEITSNWIHLTNANCFYDRVSISEMVCFVIYSFTI